MMDTLSNITFDEVLKLLGWISTFTMALIAAILGPILKKRWKEEAKAESSVSISGQPIRIQNTPGFVTFNDIKPLTDRMERFDQDLRDLRRDQGEQYRQLLESGQERETRIKEKMDDVARDWHARLDLQFGPKPRSSR
ncbi:hypothetical protein OVA24_06310 [Luteolibacter sp. SL250]|uniref:hypothetical protein n=1 Tax=Luteolibacter sp. SL250 TaxID=2995170 RepID=UPI002271C352|nr:hypothetical protein [Luteolibacter sp. SL250]WAC20994.1 hypothetical protein OVA24_06310 [Luteolibacter sp. SL250]